MLSPPLKSHAVTHDSECYTLIQFTFIISPREMPKVKATITRMKSEKKYCGGPCELSITDPSTFRHFIQITTLFI